MKKSIFLASVLALLAACTDWSDHYDDNAGYGAMAGMSLYDQIAANSELSQFKAVLDSTHLYSNNRRTSLHYSDALRGNQFYTVWAPKNGTFNCDSLLQLCATHEGDSMVGMHFLANHIARYRHASGGNEIVQLLNGKTKHLAANYMGGAFIEKADMPAANGVLNVLREDYQYHYSIYECLVSLDKFSHIGQFLRSFQVDEFDPGQSLEQGIDENGKVVYADSVFRFYNTILNRIDYIDCEDSLFYMFVPSAKLWQGLYDEAVNYFDYAYELKADSLKNYWSHFSLMQDLVYNPLWQPSINDSIISTTGSRWSYPYHIYYRPFEPGGLMSYAVDSIVCSNGVIYEIDEWPFDKHMLYHKKLSREAEGVIYNSYEAGDKAPIMERCQVNADSVSNGFLFIKPTKTANSYYVEYELPSVLSGTYDVNVVFLPKTVYDPTLDPTSTNTTMKRNFRPCQFLADVFYAGRDGKEYTVSSERKYRYDAESPSLYVEDKKNGRYIMECNLVDEDDDDIRAFKNNPFRVDTIHLATLTFPVCNLGVQKCTTRLRITSNANTDTKNYNTEMFIDQILLIPHDDETKQ